MASIRSSQRNVCEAYELAVDITLVRGELSSMNNNRRRDGGPGHLDRQWRRPPLLCTAIGGYRGAVSWNMITRFSSPRHLKGRKDDDVTMARKARTDYDRDPGEDEPRSDKRRRGVARTRTGAARRRLGTGSFPIETDGPSDRRTYGAESESVVASAQSAASQPTAILLRGHWQAKSNRMAYTHRGRAAPRRRGPSCRS
jgi:hypothetical protein